MATVTLTMGLYKESNRFSRFFMQKLYLKVVAWWKVPVIPHVRRRNDYQHVSDVDKGRIKVYPDCSLLYRSIAARVGRSKELAAELGTMSSGRVIRKAVLDLRNPLSIAEEKTDVLLASLDGSYSHIKSPEWNGVVWKTTSTCTNSSRYLQQHVNSATMTLATLDATSQTGTLSVVCSTTILDAEMAWRRVFW